MKKKLVLFWQAIKEILCSVDFWKVVVPLIIAIIAWSLNENSKLRWEQYRRKEKSYIRLLESMRGFYSFSLDSGLKKDFLDELNKCWFYAPDKVILKGYDFLETVHKGAARTNEEKKIAFGNFVLAIRKDLLSRKILNETLLEAKDFKHLKPIGK